MDHLQVRSERSVVYVVSDELAKISATLPSNKGRSIAVHTLVSKLGLLGKVSAANGQTSMGSARPLRPRFASRKELCQYHDEEYVDYVLNPKNSVASTSDASEYGVEDDCPPFPLMFKYVPLVAGASLVVAEALALGDADVAICWDGGRHHAQKSKAAGFCYVADCILSILSLKKPQNTSDGTIRPRVMYLDLDLHFSDAVSHAFHSDSRAKSNASSQVLTFSIHHAAPGFFPVSPLASLPDTSDFDPFTISLPLRQGASSKAFAQIWKYVERAREIFRPSYVVVQCGADGLAGDPCAIWNWSTGTEVGEMGWCIKKIVDTWECKTLLLGGGGYNTANAARAWATLTSIAVGTPLSPETQIPDHFAFPLYAPSFTLGVHAGNMLDTNDEEYLTRVDTIMSRILDKLSARLAS